MNYTRILRSALFWIGLFNILLLIPELATPITDISKFWDNWQGYTMLFGGMVCLERQGQLIQSGMYARLLLVERRSVMLIFSIIGSIMTSAIAYISSLFVVGHIILVVGIGLDPLSITSIGYSTTKYLHVVTGVFFSCSYSLPLLLVTRGRYAILIFLLSAFLDVALAKLIKFFAYGSADDIGWYLPSGVMSKFQQNPFEPGYLGYVYLYLVLFLILTYLALPLLKQAKRYAR